MEVLVKKDVRNGWSAENTFDLGNNMQLGILTMKRSSGKLVTTCRIGHVSDGFVSHTVFQDFHQTMKTSDARCTSKSVASQHGEALSKLPELKEAIAAFYKEKETA